MITEVSGRCFCLFKNILNICIQTFDVESTLIIGCQLISSPGSILILCQCIGAFCSCICNKFQRCITTLHTEYCVGKNIATTILFGQFQTICIHLWCTASRDFDFFITFCIRIRSVDQCRFIGVSRCDTCRFHKNCIICYFYCCIWISSIIAEQCLIF